MQENDLSKPEYCWSIIRSLVRDLESEWLLFRPGMTEGRIKTSKDSSGAQIQSNNQLNSKQMLRLNFSFVTIIGFFAATSALGQDTLKPTQIKERLNVPFGTLVKMKVEIVDGEKLNDKYHEGNFLFRIKTVDSIAVPGSMIIDFKDETGKFPTDEFELYKYLYGKEAKEITSSESKKMKKNYVGQNFTIMAYEAGEFAGVPKDYFKYQPVRQDFGFHFRHLIIVVADLTMPND
jgi:hypothetical protein